MTTATLQKKEVLIDWFNYEDIELMWDTLNYNQTYRDYVHAWEEANPNFFD